jgi:hypothetical protein
VPYLVTGDYYYLEEAYFWGNYALLAQWPVPRQDGRGIMSDQIRGNAWGLRNIADAGFIAPDGSPEAEYFEQRILNNLTEMSAKMLGPPEYNRMGFWGLRSVADARIQNPANSRWMGFRKRPKRCASCWTSPPASTACSPTPPGGSWYGSRQLLVVSRTASCGDLETAFSWAPVSVQVSCRYRRRHRGTAAATCPTYSCAVA